MLVRIYGGIVFDRMYRPECEADRIYGERGSEVIAEVEELASVLASLNAICAMSLLNIVSLLSAKRFFFRVIPFISLKNRHFQMPIRTGKVFS